MAGSKGPGLPEATVAHALPGRTRLRIPARRGDAAFFEHVGRQLSQAPGVRSVRVSSATASLLVLHDAGAAETLARVARERALFAIGAPTPANLPALRGASSAGRARPRGAAPLDMAAAGFFGLGLVQAARGRFHGNAVESFWNAYLLHAQHGRPILSFGLAGLGLYQVVTGSVLGSGVSLLLYGLAARNLARGDVAEEPG